MLQEIVAETGDSPFFQLFRARTLSDRELLRVSTRFLARNGEEVMHHLEHLVNHAVDRLLEVAACTN